jgi:hypothetical protein
MFSILSAPVTRMIYCLLYISHTFLGLVYIVPNITVRT